MPVTRRVAVEANGYVGREVLTAFQARRRGGDVEIVRACNVRKHENYVRNDHAEQHDDGRSNDERDFQNATLFQHLGEHSVASRREHAAAT